MPDVKVINDPIITGLQRLSVQTVLPVSESIWGRVAIFLWAALISLGLWGFFSTKKYQRLRIVLILAILGQLALHLIYGTDETFLYALHFAPLLLVLAAFSTFTTARSVALILTGMLVLSAGVNNVLQFDRATELFQTSSSANQQVQIDQTK